MNELHHWYVFGRSLVVMRPRVLRRLVGFSLFDCERWFISYGEISIPTSCNSVLKALKHEG